jgi:hypothetical protein
MNIKRNNQMNHNSDKRLEEQTSFKKTGGNYFTKSHTE